MTPTFYAKFFLIAFAFAATAVVSVSYAYASSNTIQPNTGGDGLGSISGYVIENVSYHLAGDSPRVDSVSFSLDAPASFVKIQLSDAQTDWYPCTNTSGYSWTCNTDTPLSAMDQLRVIAGGN